MPKVNNAFHTEFKARVQFTMDPELFARVKAYHATVGPYRTVAETLRELLWTAVLATNPNDGVIVAARKISERRTESFVLREFLTAFKDIERKVRAAADEADANALAEAHLAVQESTQRHASGE